MNFYGREQIPFLTRAVQRFIKRNYTSPLAMEFVQTLGKLVVVSASEVCIDIVSLIKTVIIWTVELMLAFIDCFTK